MKVEERLGYNGIEEIKKHSFFTGIRWNKISQWLIYPPISPSSQMRKIINEVMLEIANYLILLGRGSTK